MSLEGNGANITAVVALGSGVDKVVANGGVNWRRFDVVSITVGVYFVAVVDPFYLYGFSVDSPTYGSASNRVINYGFYTVDAGFFLDDTSPSFTVVLAGDQTGNNPFYSVQPSDGSELLRTSASVVYSGGETSYTWAATQPSSWNSEGASVSATFRYIA